MKQYRIPAGSSYWVRRDDWESVIAQISLHGVIYTEDEVLELSKGYKLPYGNALIYFRLPAQALPWKRAAFRISDVRVEERND